MPRTISPGSLVRITLTDGRTSESYTARFVRVVPDGLTMGHERKDTCVIVPEGMHAEIIVSAACVTQPKNNE